MRPGSIHRTYILGIFLLMICPAAVYGQITSSSADHSGILDYRTDTIEYPDAPRTDPYFVFNAANHGDAVTGSLRADAPVDTLDYDFSWSMYNEVTHSFDPPFSTAGGSSSNSVSGLGGGGYRVRITGPGFDTTYTAWVFLNDPLVNIVKDENGRVPEYQFYCDVLRLVSTVEEDTMKYFNPVSGDTLYLNNGMEFEWTSDDPEYEIFGGTVHKSLTIPYQPPYSSPPTIDTRFMLVAVDSFGATRGDEVLYETIHVKAEFSMWFEDRSDPDIEGGVWTESENPEEEAPLEIRFQNLSENGVKFEWALVDSAKTGDVSEFVTTDVDDSLVYTYYIPGYYYPSLVATSGAGCVDSFPIGKKPEVHVLPSELDAPNVFTPNGDGVNDHFAVLSKSIKSFRITIYSQTGRKVFYHEHREGRMEWEGWDGTINGNGNDFAETGIYYYVIDALGWDASRYRGYEPYTGFVYLFRDVQ